MTLKARNRVLALCFLCAVPFLVFFVLRITAVLDALVPFENLSLPRPRGVFQYFSALLLPRSGFAVLMAGVFLCLLSGGIQLVLYWYFEKTQVSEIFYISFFVCSLAFESLRVFLIEGFSAPWPMAWVLFAGRVLIFARFFGLFSLLASSLSACNQDYSKHGRSSFAIVGIALLVAVGIPLDGLTWLSTGMPASGYRDMLFYAEWALLGLSGISFLAAAFIREAPELRLLALAAVLVGLGRDGLLNGDNLLAVMAGAASLVAGLSIMVRRLHRYYLWM